MSAEDVTAGTIDSGSEACDVELAIAGVALGVTAGVVLFAPIRGVGATELSVDTGITETPVLVGAVFEFEVTLGPVDGLVLDTVVGPPVGELSETVVGPVDGDVPEMVVGTTLGCTGVDPDVDGASELMLGAADGTKDEMLETSLETILGAADGSGVVVGATEGVIDVAGAAVDVPGLTATETLTATEALVLGSAVVVAATEVVAGVIVAGVDGSVVLGAVVVGAVVVGVVVTGSVVVGAVAVGAVVVGFVVGSVIVGAVIVGSVGVGFVVVRSVVGGSVVVGSVVLGPVAVVVPNNAPAADVESATIELATDTAPPTTTELVSESASRDDRLLTVVGGIAVVFRNGAICLLTSLGK